MKTTRSLTKQTETLQADCSDSQIDQRMDEEEWEERKPGPLRILIQHHELIENLILRDIRSRYKQSVLGIAWALLTPFAMMLVFTIVFSHIARVNTGSIPYPIFSYIALLPWTFFNQGVTTGAESLTSNFNLITKIYFPREVFPLVAVLGKAVDLGLGILALIPLYIFYHIHITWLMVIVVPVLVMQICLMLGIALLLSSINVFYRDIRHIVPLLLQVWFFMTPIIYPLNMVPKRYMGIYMLNPMASMMDTYRRVALLGQSPMWDYLGLAAIMSIIALITGYCVFKRQEPAFAEII